MRYLYQSLILSLLLLVSTAEAAFDAFFDVLYWRVTQPIDWVYLNNRNSSNQDITFKTIDFNYKPGFRLGASYERAWDVKFYYTYYFTKASDATSGNLTSSFLGAKVLEPSSGYFYQAEQIDFAINYNMFDLDFGKRFIISDALMIHPLIGLAGGWINQTINTFLQGTTSVNENISNNFIGLGPKIGIGGRLNFLHKNDFFYSLVADFSVAYLWGNWTIRDVATSNTSNKIDIAIPKRDLGTLGLQALIGINMDYKNVTIKLGYEINDWLNQFQVFDNDTGAHNNNLILQGLTLKIQWVGDRWF